MSKGAGPLACPTSGPAGLPPSSRVLRGGAFNNHLMNARSAYRNDNGPANHNNKVGLRVASTSRQTPRLPGRNPEAKSFLRSVPKCQVQAVVPCQGASASWPKEAFARRVW
jgi:hypothetical protein